MRVPTDLKDRLRTAVDQLRRRGMRTSESELIEQLVTDALAADITDIEDALRQWRVARENT